MTISNLRSTEKFYSRIPGPSAFKDEYTAMYHIGATKLFFIAPEEGTPGNDRFNPNRIGLDHLAIGVHSLVNLKEVEINLNRNSIQHSGIHIDRHSKKEKIWLNDPDGIRIEFFVR